MEKDETKAVENAEPESIKETELTDGQAESEKTETDDKTPKEGQPKKQSKEDNARFAEARRQREKAELLAKQEQEAREKEIYDKGYKKAQIDSVKTNPYTGDEITNEHDLEVYLTMKEFDEQGKDPLKEFPKYWSKKLTEADEKQKAEEEETQRQKEQKEAEDKALKTKIATEREELVKAHPEIDLNELVKNEDFKTYANNKFGRWTYLEIVEGWLSKNPNNVAKRNNSEKRSSSVSSVATGSKVTKSFKDMTDDEYEAYCKSKYGSF